MSDLDREIAQAAAWLREQAAHVLFGTLTVSITLHRGGVSKVERGVSETRKNQPDNEGTCERPQN